MILLECVGIYDLNGRIESRNIGHNFLIVSNIINVFVMLTSSALKPVTMN